MTTWAIIPVKPLRYGKSRLAHILTAEERAGLTSNMLRRTLCVLNEVAGIFRCLLVSRDPVALKIGRQYGASTYDEGEKQDLNVALSRGAHIAAAQGATGILVVPADLPLITADDVEMMFAGLAPRIDPLRATGSTNGSISFHRPRAAAICPDHEEDGTNALYVSPPTGFEFQYGEGSFDRHLREAERLGMEARIVHAPGLKFDLDTAEDLRTYWAMNGALAEPG